MTRAGKTLDSFEKISLPSGEKNAGWFERAKEIRASLNAFWAEMLQADLKIFTPDDPKIKIDEAAVDTAVEMLKVGIKQGVIEDQAAQEMLQQQQKQHLVSLVGTGVQTVWGRDERTTCRFHHLEIAEKMKTKGVASDSELQESRLGVAMSDLAVSTPAQVFLKKRHLDVFMRMYPLDADDARTVEWDSFVMAMAGTGFRAHHSGGSAVVFDDDSGRKISFHRPHPDSKIDYIKLQNMGRYLNKRFGCQRESFCLVLDEA